MAAVGCQNRLAACVSIEEYVAERSSTCFGQPCAHPQELTTQWFYRRVWCSAVAAVGCQNRLAGCVSMEEYVVLRTDSLQQSRHYTTRGDKTTESSAPEDGHKVARNMLSYL